MKYADAGTIVHKVLQSFYENHKKSLAGQQTDVVQPIIENLRIVFERVWSEYSPKLEKELYWRMVVQGLFARDLQNKPLELTSCELEIFFPDFVSYLDGVHSMYKDPRFPDREGLIVDWKTSSRKEEKDDQYTNQLAAYAWVYWRKFKVLPVACVVYYLKYPDEKLEYFPTMEDVLQVDEYYKKISSEVDYLLSKKDDISLFTRASETQDAKPCFWCPYKQQCKQQDNVDTWNIVIRGDTITVKQRLDDKIHLALENKMNYMMKDAHWAQKAIMAKTGRHFDGIIRQWKRPKQRTTIGYLRTLMFVLQQWSEHHKRKYKFILEDARARMVDPLPYPEELVGIELFDYQKEAVHAALRGKLGTIEVPTGGGKTIICAEIMRHIKGKALFVIDNKDLLWQTRDAYEKFLGMKCGVVGAGEEDWSQPVTLATIQTLTKRVKNKEHDTLRELEKIQVLIADECHLWAAKSYSIVSKALPNAWYRIGCSGTLLRDDGNEKMIEAFIGTPLYKIEASRLRDKGVIMMPRIVFLKHNFHIDTEDWREAYEALIESDARNDLVVKAATEAVARGKKVLILAKRIAHCQKLYGLLRTRIDSTWLVIGETEDEQRKSSVDAFRDSKSGILVGNMSIFNKGMNVPDLDVLINAAGNAGIVATIQSLGRILRVSEGKDKPIFIDFNDKGSYVEDHTTNRKEAFTARGYTVEPIEFDRLFS